MKGIPERGSTVFLMVDMQEKLVNAMHGKERVVRNASVLVKAAEILGIPLIATEQYPKGLGRTVSELGISSAIEKVHFNCFENEEFASKIAVLKPKHLVIFGVEAHVCVLKTALDAASRGMDVYVVADAVASRTEENKNIALERLKQSGVFIASTEMILFQLIDKAGTDEFRQISGLIK